jgi:hypothetical protein
LQHEYDATTENTANLIAISNTGVRISMKIKGTTGRDNKGLLICKLKSEKTTKATKQRPEGETGTA